MYVLPLLPYHRMYHAPILVYHIPLSFLICALGENKIERQTHQMRMCLCISTLVSVCVSVKRYINVCRVNQIIPNIMASRCTQLKTTLGCVYVCMYVCVSIAKPNTATVLITPSIKCLCLPLLIKKIRPNFCCWCCSQHIYSEMICYQQPKKIALAC